MQCLEKASADANCVVDLLGEWWYTDTLENWEAVVMDLDRGSSSSAISTTARANPGRPVRHGGGFYFLFRLVFNYFCWFRMENVLGYCIKSISERWFCCILMNCTSFWKFLHFQFNLYILLLNLTIDCIGKE